MSEPGPSTFAGVDISATPSTTPEPASAIPNHDLLLSNAPGHQTSHKHVAAQSQSDSQSPIEMQVHFDDFAAQLRLHRHNEHRRRMLEHRRSHLQKAVTLSARIRRLSSWVHDGLVEISRFHNAPDFVRVHQHLLDLRDICFSQWNHDIRALDPVVSNATLPSNISASFFSRLSSTSQNDCLQFIQHVRSSPRFLVDRFKAVSPSQLVALSTSPRFEKPSDNLLASLSSNRGRYSQRKYVQNYAVKLEEYISAFERKNPMSFLMHNCFGVNSPSEDRLRLETWSSVCALLCTEIPWDDFLPFFGQVLWEFSTLYGWRAKDRLELFSMDILQRGAFLLEPVGDYKRGVLEMPVTDALATDEARIFFDQAVRDFFIILREEGMPLGPLMLTQALLAKLSDIEAQSKIRGFVFFRWFMLDFLHPAVAYPENQKLLLQFHISDSARTTILHKFHRWAYDRAFETSEQDPARPPDPEVSAAIWTMTNELHPKPLIESNLASTDGSKPLLPSLTICAADLVHVLESLSQQYALRHFEPFLHESMSTFETMYSRARPKLDKLRRELQLLFEPGHSSTAVHPVQEQWITLTVGTEGQVSIPDMAGDGNEITHALSDKLGPLNPTQRAVIRLALEDDGEPLYFSRSPTSASPASLLDLFSDKFRNARSAANGVDAFFWDSAMCYLESNYVSATWTRNDSRILRPLLKALSFKTPAKDQFSLESHVQALEEEYSKSKKAMGEVTQCLDHLKVKMWYTMNVVNSREYENARNISKALNYMALPPQLIPEPAYSVSSGTSRPGTSTSTTSSLFEQPRFDTMRILRAPKDHGGPKKLADEQIEMTKKWLNRNEIENFCKGEERIHRFCMEIRVAAKKLVADSMAEAPVLWSSDLWVREKHAFDPPSMGIPMSTRPSSVISETSSAPPWLRPSLGAASRSLDPENASSSGRKGSLYGISGTRLNKDILGSELATSLASQGRTGTTMSGESVLSGGSPFLSQTRSQTSNSLPSPSPSIWSSVYSQSRSQTTISLPSRPGSIYDDISHVNLNDSSVEKSKFLDTLQRGLMVLLLSDLGNPVWSLGSETDAWMASHRAHERIAQRLVRRKQMSDLLTPASSAEVTSSRRVAGNRRTWSADDSREAIRNASHIKHTLPTTSNSTPDLMELEEVLNKISHQVDPTSKLQAVYEFRQLALLSLEKSSPGSPPVPVPNPSRRRSLGTSTISPRPEYEDPVGVPASRTENEIRDHLKDLLLALNTKTLFRDLQYIAAFTNSDTLNKTDSGRAFVQVGLAALAAKDEVCRTMVELADQIVAKDSIKRQVSQDDGESGLAKAREYWILAAREGNAIAQRELGSLYLAHPEVSVPPAITAPMSLSGDVFKSEMMWSARVEDERGDKQRQGLCLALHWMQHAAAGGDLVARRKLEERKKGIEGEIGAR